MKRLMLVAAALVSVGCTTTNSLGYIPQSNFSFPNSNVIPMNTVQGSTTAVSFGFLPPGLSGSSIETAVNNAKSQAVGADLLLNVVGNVSVTTIPLILIPGSFYFTKVEVEGVAAKAELGRQQLQ